MNAECKTESKNPVACGESRNPLHRFKPAVDVVESGETVVLTVDLPGVAEENVDVTLE